MLHAAITSIYPPTRTIYKLAEIGADIVVIGDRKSKTPYIAPRTRFFTLTDQQSLGFRIAQHLPVDHYSRKMLAYLLLAREGAASIYDTDDDNVPYETFCFPPFEGRFDEITQCEQFFNIYRAFADEAIWPRGLPLDTISSNTPYTIGRSPKPSRVGIWQGLADGDPDVDAIYRLTSLGEPIKFRTREPLILPTGTFTPFNSQSTLIQNKFFPLLYLPTTVTFRYTDILRGIIGQAILWATGHHLGFVSAQVFQDRNPHDYMSDFRSEIPMYLSVREAAQIALANSGKDKSIPNMLHDIYRDLTKAGITTDKEMRLLDAWLADIEEASGSLPYGEES